MEHSLRKLGFEVSAVRVGRVIDLDVAADGAEAARSEVERMCEALLANPLIESFDVRVDGA